MVLLVGFNRSIFNFHNTNNEWSHSSISYLEFIKEIEYVTEMSFTHDMTIILFESNT